MSLITMLTLGGFALVLIGLGGVFGLGWTLAGGMVLAVGVLGMVAAWVLDRLGVVRRSVRNARRIIR